MTYVPPPVPERWGIGKWGQAHWDGDLAVAATSGSILLAPKTAGLRVGHGITAGVGSIVLAPQTVALKVSSRLQAQSGSIVLTGQLVTLRSSVGQRLAATAGAIVLTGQTANLVLTVIPPIHDHVLEATTGTIVVTGRMAILTATREPTEPIIQPGVLNMGRRVIILPNRW